MSNESIICNADEPNDATDQIVHIDDWLDNAIGDVVGNSELAYAHFVFSHFRKPAWEKMSHAPFMRDHKLFVTYEGKRYRVTGASRLGDIWLTEDFKRQDGYDLRIGLDFSKLSNWSPKP